MLQLLQMLYNLPSIFLFHSFNFSDFQKYTVPRNNYDH